MDHTKEPFLEIEKADVYRNNQLIFKELSWTIHKDENWIISGPMASGKSALSEFLTGKHFARKGQINYPFLATEIKAGASIYTLKRERIFRVSFADQQRKFNTQNHYYQQRFNAFDNEGISVAAYLETFDFDPANALHQTIIDRIGLRELLPISRIKLSSGQVRKLLICTAIFKQPDLLIIDNPYIGLDKTSRKDFNTLLDDLATEKGIKIILSGQYQELPNCISHCLELDNFQVVYKGRIVDKPVFNRPFKSNVALQKIQAYYAEPTNIQFETIFKLSDVTIKYDADYVLKDFNWTINSGEKWALIGPNGSGKSTILSLFFGDHPQVYSNQVLLFDKDRRSNGSIWDIKRKIGFVSPELHFFFGYNFNCLNIALSGFQDAFFLLRKATSNEKAQAKLFFEYFEVEYLMDRTFKLISTGEQRLVLLIRALVKNAAVLLLDEPFQGLDEKIIERARILLDAILSPKHTFIFISHYEAEIPNCVDKRLELSAG